MTYSALPEDYAARALSLCIMQPTVSGGDAGIFRRLHTLLRQLFPRLFSLCSCETLGGGALLLHLPGTPEGQPLVFLSHLDVVSPGDISAWTHPPFGGETHGGYIYGRGAADMKGHLVALLTASEGLLSEGWQPGGDIWLAFSCDEETRGGSMAAMARLLQARGVHPAFILDEGGNVSQPFSLTRKPFATVGVAEKGRLLFSLSCTAPRALEELSRAAARISRIHPRARLCDPVLSDMLPAMRPLMNGRDRFCLSHGRLFHGSLLHRLSRTATGRAITRTQLSLWKQSGDALLGSEDKLRANENSFDSVVAAQGYAYPLANFRELFSQDDYTTVNLESVLKDDSTDKLDGRLYNFRGPTSFVNILLAASVEHANIANNHYIDYGVSGRRSTRDTLQRAGIAYSGYTYTHIFEKDGVKIGFAGIRESMWHQNRATMTNEIKALKKADCDYIVYACHWGTEYAENHNDIQKLMATYAIDAGADCVIGTHPHVVQGVEVYNGKPIFYSLGNFVFGGNLNPTDYDGLVVQLTLHFDHQVCDDVQARLIPILTSGVQDGTTNFQPVMAEGEEKDRILNRIQQDSPAEISEIMTF